MKRKKTRPEATSRLRNWQCQEIYHVYQRGNYKQQIFYTPEQLVIYLHRLDLLARRYDVRIHSYCLMSNHIHFLLEPARIGGISRLMQSLQSYHSRWIHRTQNRDGHLWKNRFKAVRITSPAHYRKALLFIERSPTVAALVRHAERYPYSSAAAHVANSASQVFRHGNREATVNLHLARWQLEFGLDYRWQDWLRDPPAATMDADLLAVVQRILGKDCRSPLNPVDLPPPLPSGRASPSAMTVARAG